MSREDFSVEESAALLHAIFPNYPDTHVMKPTPEIGAFLRTLRAATSLAQPAMDKRPPRGGQLAIEDLGGRLGRWLANSQVSRSFARSAARNSIKVFERPGGLHLYRCECGHSFLLDTAREQVVDETKNSKVSRGWLI